MTRLTRILVLVGLIVAVLVPWSSSQADMSLSSIVNIMPNPVTEGATFDFSITVHFLSSDSQWGDYFSITVPSEWTINSIGPNPVTMPGVPVTQEIIGQTLVWRDVDINDAVGGFGFDQTHTLTANVTVNACLNAPWTLPYTVGGDTFGGDDPPINGSVVVTGLGNCGTSSVATAGGNDMIDLPDTAVVGSFVDYTPLYYLPVEGATSDYAMEPGKTLYVFGVDATGKFYKVLMSGEFYWVPVDKMGPNFDDVWRGTPLPTNVVS